MAYYLPDGSLYTGETHSTGGTLMSGATHTSSSQALSQRPDSQTNPHITNGNSPLRTLSMQALRRFGDFNATTVDGDVLLMFLEFANMVIDDVRMHAYAPRTTYSSATGTSTTKDLIEYYRAVDEIRNVDDQIIVAGLLAHYSLQQGSEKAEIYMPSYYRTMNQQLWRALNGNTPIQMRVMDDGTNPSNSQGLKTSVINGNIAT